MMQRKHYNAIAAALRSGKANKTLVTDMAMVLLGANKNFDLDKFVEKATRGPSMEQRAAKYLSHLKTLERWHTRNLTVYSECPRPFKAEA